MADCPVQGCAAAQQRLPIPSLCLLSCLITMTPCLAGPLGLILSAEMLSVQLLLQLRQLQLSHLLLLLITKSLQLQPLPVQVLGLAIRYQTPQPRYQTPQRLPNERKGRFCSSRERKKGMVRLDLSCKIGSICEFVTL